MGVRHVAAVTWWRQYAAFSKGLLYAILAGTLGAYNQPFKIHFQRGKLS